LFICVLRGAFPSVDGFQIVQQRQQRCPLVRAQAQRQLLLRVLPEWRALSLPARQLHTQLLQTA